MKSQKSHQREFLDGSDPVYKEMGFRDLRIPPTEVGVAPWKARDEGRRKQETRQRYPVGEISTETHLSKA